MGKLAALPTPEGPILPYTVKVGHRSFNIEYDNMHLDNVEADGLTTRTGRIILRDNAVIDMQREIVLHEILHAIFFATGVELTQVEQEHVEERAVATLAGGLVQVLRDNPDLVAYLVQEDEL